MLGGNVGLIEAKLDEARPLLLTEEQPGGTQDASTLARTTRASLLAMQTLVCQPMRAVEFHEEYLP
jgi:hypothetical protein